MVNFLQSHNYIFLNADNNPSIYQIKLPLKVEKKLPDVPNGQSKINKLTLKPKNLVNTLV